MIDIKNDNDFLMNLQFKDSSREVIPIPIFNFKIEYFVRPENKVTVEFKDGVYVLDEHTKVTIDGDTLIIGCDTPLIDKGILRSRKIYNIPNEKFPDGKQIITEESDTNYRLI